MRPLCCSLLLLFLCFQRAPPKRTFRGHKAGQTGLMLPFHRPLKRRKFLHPRGAHITKSSHFAQSFKLGYKVLLVCEAKGKPYPQVLWYKDGAEVPRKLNTHFYEKRLKHRKIKSKIEIDPATLGDQGIYVCLASNPYSFDHRSFKTEYYY